MSLMMKRNNEGVPLRMMQRWSRPPMSCQLCRSKKLRCDRTEPCSNCSLRKVDCVYAGKPAKQHEQSKFAAPQGRPEAQAAKPVAQDASSTNNTEELLARIKLLEQAVFDKNAQSSQQASDTAHTPTSMSTASLQSPAIQNSSPKNLETPFSMFLSSDLHIPKSARDEPPDPSLLSKHLPPKVQALELFKHLSTTSQLTFGVFHVPSTRSMLIQTYQKLLEGENPDIPTFFLLFCIFAGATLISTPKLLQSMGSNTEEARATFERYSTLALSIIENTAQPLAPSMKALEGTVSLMHLFTNADGFTGKVHMLRTRALLMAHALQIHRLDTTRNREQRQMQGFNPVEIEVKRRIWWHMVSSDWLLSFSGGSQEGTYLFNSKHMKVNYPRNIDDELIAAAGEQYDFPLCIATQASAFIVRLKLAEICREVTDTVPSIILEPQEVDYNTVLELDAKFRKYMDEFPVFFKLDPASIQQSLDTCRERPYIAFHRILLHLGVYTRICRLHRPYLFAGYHDPKYAFSRTSCVRAAQKMLEMRRLMDEYGEMGDLIPSCYWTVMQHVFMAAITLATDVSLDPSAPYANVRKAEVLAACRMLERSQQESVIARESIQRGVQTLMTMIHKKCPLISRKSVGFATLPEDSLNPTELLPLNQPAAQTSTETDTSANFIQATRMMDTQIASSYHENMQNTDVLGDFGEQDWDQLWSEFFNVSPEWDTPKWNYMMEGIEMNLGPNLS